MAGIPTLFVTDRVLVHQQMALQALPDGFEVTMLESPSRDEVLTSLGDIEILVSERTGVVDEAHLESGPNLRLIQRIGSQVHDLDLEAAQRAGVAVCFWPLPQSRMVAEHVLMQMLVLVKRAREGSEVVIEAAPWGDGPQRTDGNTFKMNWSGRTDIGQIHDSTVLEATQLTDIDDGVELLEVLVVEAPLRQPPEQRHLAAFPAKSGGPAGTRLGAAVASTRRLAMAGTRAAPDPLTGLVLEAVGLDLFQVHETFTPRNLSTVSRSRSCAKATSVALVTFRALVEP